MSRWHWLFPPLLISCFGYVSGEYLGCYRDSEDGLMKGHTQNFLLTLTPDRCVDLCTKKGFMYAGLKSRITCLCDSRDPPKRFRSEESLCQGSCVGDNTKRCGGNEALSVYSTRLSEKEPSDREPLSNSFIGCYVDHNSSRLLTGFVQDLPKNTPEKCKALCYQMGYLYSGVENGKQCFCGDTHPPPAHLKDVSQCSVACPGDLSWKCGANARISIYETGITDIPEVGMKLGCYDDEKPRVLDNGSKMELENTNSPRRCMNICRSLSYEYSGVEYGKECFCSNSIRANNTVRDSADAECSTVCPGDIFETCGANWELMVYRTGLSDPMPVIKKVGCFTTEGPQILNGFRRDFTDIKSPHKCAKLCYNKGFSYAAIISRKECWCDNKQPSKSLLVEEDTEEECERTHAAVYETGYTVPQPGHKGTYIGCFTSDKKGKALGGFHRKFENHLTPQNCSRLCFNKGYLYSGTRNKNECHCGDEQPEESLTRASDDECSSLCSGDRSKYCGGNGKLSIYSTGIKEVSTTGKRLGCFKDETRPGTLDGHKTDLENTNSPQRCLSYCQQLGFKFAGVEYQKECFCGNSGPSSMLDVEDLECNSICTGDSSQKCGGGWRISVYRTGYTTVAPDPVVMPETTLKPNTSCELSDTLVNGKPVCQGVIVFRDTFNTPSISSNWQHVVKIADAPDYEFVVFTSNPANSFQRDGKLVIKPTLQSDANVQEGTIKLQGCTGLAGTRECELTAFSYNILPPVRSARINTHKSFSFRYGTVEIRARLPAGDWLVPELWLLPKDQSYGINYFSGKIRVAMSRGNRRLTCNGVDKGSSTLESGILVGTEDNVTARSVVNKIADSWSSHVHNYTLVWTPDNLSFYVDGQSQQALLPPHVRLTELLGFNKTDTSVWNTGSRIAPFDTDFYLSLGLSAGGSRDFPDGCIGKDKEKPWANFKLKAILNYWLDRESWKPSWDDETSSLIVEHVQVTAL